jgi:membrane peptidoglycan carboxypeptidase
VQRKADDAVESRLEEYGNDELEAALVAIDPSTGYVKAMVGGRDYNVDQFNLATMARRQPGSSFKMFTLATAMSEGMNPSIYVNCNSPIQFTPTWQVQNFDNYSYGNITLAEATARSSNTGYVQVAETVDPENIVDYAKRMGIDEELPAYASITLGTVGIPPVQMAEAYATLATGGLHRDSVVVTRIEDRNGNVIYQHEDTPEQALEPEIAQAETEVLEGVINQGYGTAHDMQGMIHVDQPVAGKTGTSENYRDLWFCGYTPQISVSIWCGYRTESTVYVGRDVAHPYSTACPIFASFVNTLLSGLDRMEFPTTTAKPEYKSNSEWSFSFTDSYTSSREDGVFGEDNYYNYYNDYSSNSYNNYNSYNSYDYGGYSDYDYSGYSSYDYSGYDSSGYSDSSSYDYSSYDSSYDSSYGSDSYSDYYGDDYSGY